MDRLGSCKKHWLAFFSTGVSVVVNLTNAIKQAKPINKAHENVFGMNVVSGLIFLPASPRRDRCGEVARGGAPTKRAGTPESITTVANYNTAW